MPLTEQQKSTLCGLEAFGFFVGGVPALSSSDEDDEFDGDLDIESLRPGRHLELISLVSREDGKDNVHDNPTYTASDGAKIRPDVVVAHNDDVIEFREANDLIELREIHVWQTARYDADLVPRDGKTTDIPDDSVVPRDVRRLARSLDIAIQRVRRP